jgi:hypothetical protein
MKKSKLRFSGRFALSHGVQPGRDIFCFIGFGRPMARLDVNIYFQLKKGAADAAPKTETYALYSFDGDPEPRITPASSLILEPVSAAIQC